MLRCRANQRFTVTRPSEESSLASPSLSSIEILGILGGAVFACASPVGAGLASGLGFDALNVRASRKWTSRGVHVEPLAVL